MMLHITILKKTIIEYLNKTDLKNGTNWKDIWPEFQEYVNES